MPRACIEHSPGVFIQLDKLEPVYRPGENVTGVVLILMSEVALISHDQMRVQLQLYGRTKTTEASPDLGTTVRGQARLFEISVDLTEYIVQYERYIWPFSVPLPTSPQPNALKKGDNWEPVKGRWLSNLSETSNHLIPASYYYYGENPSTLTTVEAYVEYAMKATVFHSPMVSYASIMPLILRSNASETPILDLKLQHKDKKVTITTYDLLPSKPPLSPSFVNHMKRALRTPSVPHYSFDLKVEFPQVIQLDHSDPIPFIITLVPNLDKSYLGAQSNAADLPTVKFVSISMYLESIVQTRSKKPSSLDQQHRNVLKYPIASLSAVELRDMVIPSIKSSNTGKSKEAGIKIQQTSESLDLGRLLDLRLSLTQGQCRKRLPVTFHPPLWPTFQSYNIDLAYKLHWRIELECAGERKTIKSDPETSQCQILSPSEVSVEEAIRNPMPEFGKDNSGYISLQHWLSIEGHP